MDSVKITPEREKELLLNFFNKTRSTLQHYFDERSLVLSNSQLFAFILVSPIPVAIASDGNVDFTETTMLVDVAAYFERDILPSELDALPQPPNRLADQEFIKLIYTELRFLCVSMERFEEPLITCIRHLIELDETLSASKDDPKFSIRDRVVQMMESVIYNNLGPDSVEEKKMDYVLTELGISRNN